MEQAGQSMRRTWVVYILISIVFPALIAATGAWMQWQWRSELPDPIATHWNARDVADGFSTLPSSIASTVCIGALTPLIVSVLIMPSMRKRQASTAIIRFQGATCLWLGVFLTLLVTLGVASQRGLTDAREVGGTGAALVVGMFVGLVVAVPAAFLIPAVQVKKMPTTSPGSLLLSRSESLMWSETVSIRAGHAWFFYLLGCGVVACGFALLMRGDSLWLAVVLFLSALPLITGPLIERRMSVVVDRRGLTVRSWLGWPRFRARLGEIATVSVGETDAFGEFGGWGLRYRPGKWGIVMKSGEALRVKRANGSELVVVVNGATEAAAVLAALVERA